MNNTTNSQQIPMQKDHAEDYEGFGSYQRKWPQK